MVTSGRFPNDLRTVVVLDLFVAGDDEGGFECGNRAQVGDPLCPLGFTCLGGHQVHLVVGQIPGDDRGQRRNIEDSGFRGIRRTDPDDLQLVSFQIDRVAGEQLPGRFVTWPLGRDSAHERPARGRVDLEREIRWGLRSVFGGHGFRLSVGLTSRGWPSSSSPG